MSNAGSTDSSSYRSPYLTWSLMSGGIADFIDPEWTHYTGRSIDELSGMKWLHVIHPDDRMHWLQAIEQTTEDVAEFECRILGINNTYHWFLVRGQREASLPYEPEFWTGYCVEINTMRLSFKDRIATLEQEKNQTDRFIAMLGHELRTPLAAAQLSLDSITDDKLSEHARTSLGMARRNLLLGSTILNDLLEMARLKHNKVRLDLDVINLHTLLSDVLAICHNDVARKHIRIVHTLQADHHTVIGDATRLHQVFWNIIRNGVQHTPPGGLIFIRTSVEQQEIVVEIRDTGIGLDTRNRQLITTLLNQQADVWPSITDGLGLGLSICASFVTMHSGTITVDSDGIGTGSTFTVYLPVSPEHPQPEHQTTTPEPDTADSDTADSDTTDSDTASNHQQHHILIVDDHVGMVTIYQHLLGQQGYAVTGASSMTEALNIWHRESFDLLITDIGLPDGDGIELLRRLREQQPLQAIAVSGYSTQADIDRSLAEGFIAHLVKPFSIAELEKVIRRVMEEQG